MSTFFLVVLTVLLTAALLWAYQTAQRLNRLHIRTDSSLLALQAALDKRAALIAALEPEMQPAARAAELIPLEYASFSRRAEKEREISARIAGMGEEAPARIVDAEARLQLAHRFYNEAVADTRALRTRPLVRMLRLGGTAKLPEFFEFTEF